MGRALKFLLAATSALTLSVSTPAMALNPQPLPPGAHRGASKFHPFAFTVKQGYAGSQGAIAPPHSRLAWLFQ